MVRERNYRPWVYLVWVEELQVRDMQAHYLLIVPHLGSCCMGIYQWRGHKT